MDNINNRINELLTELNQLMACKFFHELKWEDLMFTTNTHTQTKIIYQMVIINVPEYGKSDDKRIKMSLGRKDDFDLKVNDDSFKMKVISKIKEFGLSKFGC